MTRKGMGLRMTGVGIAAVVMAALAALNAQSSGSAAVSIDDDDLGGVVTSRNGPEAGVWVIAETDDLGTKFSRTVVTDDRGRYVIPDLPKATYSVWVRGYGLVDSPKEQAGPGKVMNLTAVVAPNPRAAAEYYPSNYWYSLMHVPAKSEFPGTGPEGNGISPNVRSQAAWVDRLKASGCTSCHQLGDKATREIPQIIRSQVPSSAAAWDLRIQAGQAGGTMLTRWAAMGRQGAAAAYADWTDRIAAGELPPVPPRPVGVERNVVITQWDWAEPKVYLHDEIGTDKRNPTVNANGLLYGMLENSADYLAVMDPMRHAAARLKVPVRDPKTPGSGPPLKPSPYWGEEAIWNSQTAVHSAAMDTQGRLWIAARIRPQETQAFCKAGSGHPSAAAFPLDLSGKQLAMYDPRTKQFTTIDTCFGTHHVQLAQDTNNTLWFCGGGPVVGWFNTKMYDQTKDEEKSQGWTALVLDTNGNGKRDTYTEPDRPIDPTKDRRINAPWYGVAPSAVDGSIWGSINEFPGGVVRLVPGSNPPATALAEFYELPWNSRAAGSVTRAAGTDAEAGGRDGTPVQGYAPRGIDVDRSTGVVWVSLSSGHLASFDRRKCKGPLNGPTATGQHCSEGWKFHQAPGPNFKGVTDSVSADTNYYVFVDQFDTFGLGKNTPIALGSGSDSLLALVDGKFNVLRVPYPIGFFAKGIDGRIDNLNAGWKGRGLWSTYGPQAPFHKEGGKETTGKLLKFQLRPNPLAK